MDNLFILLFFVSIVMLFVGLIKPNVFARFLKKRATRKGVAIIFGISTIVFFVLFGITTDYSSQIQSTTNTSNPVATKQQEPAIEPAKALSEEEQIQKIVSDQLTGVNNMDKAYMKRIDVVEQVNGGWGVFVEYNADDNFTINLRKGSIELKMSEIYLALYRSNKDIRSVSIAAYFPLVDKYGNQSENVTYKSILDKAEADKVNWNADEATLKVSILPNVWTTSILHPEFR